jgi:hypothetical protein
MSARKPLALALVICSLTGTTVHADPITWPSGLDNWLIYLAAPSGAVGTGPVNYTVPSTPVTTSPAAAVSPVYTAPAAIPSAETVPDAPSQPVPSQPVPVQLPTSSPLVVSQPVAAPSVISTPAASAQMVAAPIAASTPAAAPQLSVIQPFTYTSPTSSQPATVQPLIYTPPTVTANAPLTATPPAAVAQSMQSTAPAPAASAAPASAGSAALSTVAAPASAPVQAFINVGSGPYPQAAGITTGGAQPWYNSTQLTNLFGGQPTAQQIQSFDNAILQRVQQTFSQSGISVSLTENPNTPALHTISLVSNTASASLPTAIGMTQVGGNGFSFIDQIAPSTQSLDQLEWIAAHNISHELMLAFGVPENYDTTGTYIDSKLANWAMMVNPNSTFSSAAAQAITQALSAPNQSSISQLGAQEINPSAVPEPTTIAIWGIAALALAIARCRPWRRRGVLLAV